MIPQTSMRGDEFVKVAAIAARAVAIAEEHDVSYTSLDATMDLMMCHQHAYRLDLDRLLDAHEVDFVHDVFGIRKYIDHSTGELRECFVPRHALSRVQPEGGE